MSHGSCPYGDRCQYAHGRSELRYNNNEIPSIIEVLTSNQKYKTKDCREFLRKGFCPYGETCNYLHRQTKSINGKVLRKYDKGENVTDDGFKKLIMYARP